MSWSINVAAGLKKLSCSYLGIRVIFPCTHDLSLQSPICHALMTLEFLLGDKTGLDWTESSFPVKKLNQRVEGEVLAATCSSVEGIMVAL